MKFQLKLLLLMVCFLAVPVLGKADTLELVLERGAMRIGLIDAVPSSFKKGDGSLDGFDVAVGKRIAADIGIEAEFRTYSLGEVLKALQTGEVDMIAAGVAITPQRALVVDFTQPYFESGLALAANKKATENIASLEELDTEAVVVAVVNNSLGQDFAQRFFNNAKVEPFATIEAAETAVKTGSAAVYVTSVQAAKFLALRNPDEIDAPLNTPLVGSRSGLVVRRGEQAFLNLLNAWITSREADRWLASTYDYWYESLDWAGDVAK